MALEQIISTIQIIIDGRKLIGGSYITREPGAAEWEVRARLMNRDRIGCIDTMLASFADSATAVRVKNALNY